MFSIIDVARNATALVGKMSSVYLPTEIRLMVLQALVEDGSRLAPFATVSREWLGVIEQHTFARIKLTPPSIAELDSMTSRNRARVRCLWLCLELERYDCTACASESAATTSNTEDALITTAFQDFFSLFSATGSHKAPYPSILMSTRQAIRSIGSNS